MPNEEQLVINTYNDYNAPVDNKNIIWGYWPGLENGKKSEIYKMFRIIPGIWMVADQIALEDETPRKPGVYDSNYVSTNKLKSKYLHQMSTLIQRLASKKLGKNLLKCLSNNPIMVDKNNLTTFIRVLETPKNNPHKTKDIIAYEHINIFISPPTGNLSACSSRNITLTEQSFAFNSSHQNICGSTSWIQFAPDVVPSSWDLLNDRLIFLDPILGLGHEMIHALHCLFGVMADYGKISLIQTDLEEGITFGSSDAIIARKNRSLSLEKFKLNFVKYTDKIINKNILSEVNKELITNIMVKYGLTQNSKTGTISFETNLDDAFEKYIDLAWNTFDETKLALEFDLPNRSHYSQGDVPLIFYLDATNPKYYNIENGIGGKNKKYTTSPSKKFFLDVHPNFYVGDNNKTLYTEVNKGKLYKIPNDILEKAQKYAILINMHWDDIIIHDRYNSPNPTEKKPKGTLPKLRDYQIEKVLPNLEKEIEKLRIELKNVVK